MKFSEALDAVKQGKRISREGWNGKDMFVFMRPSDNIPVATLLGLKSLSNKVKDYFELKYQPITETKNPLIKFTAYLCMKASDDSIVNGWLASQTDMLSDDWVVLD